MISKRFKIEHKGFGLGGFVQVPEKNIDVKHLKCQPTVYNGMLKYTYKDSFGVFVTHKSLDLINNWTLGRVTGSVLLKPTSRFTLAARASKQGTKSA